MKKYITNEEINTLLFLYYFKYTSFAFKKVKSEEESASIFAHRTLIRIFWVFIMTKRIGCKGV